MMDYNSIQPLYTLQLFNTELFMVNVLQLVFLNINDK